MEIKIDLIYLQEIAIKMKYINMEKDNFYENYNRYIDFLKTKEYLFIFGSELSSSNIIELLKEEKLFDRVEGFVNNSISKEDIYDKKCISPSNLINLLNKKESLVIIAAQQQKAIQMQLEKLQISTNQIDCRGFGLAKDYFTFRNTKTPFEIINGNLPKISRVFDLLEDEKSKEVLGNILSSKITLDNSYLNDIASLPTEQYFDKSLIKLKDDEIFCDCGSFNGDTH